MNEIKIRGISNEVLAKIDDLRGNESRNSFIKKQLEILTKKTYVEEIETRYDELLRLTLKTIDKNTTILKEFFEEVENED